MEAEVVLGKIALHLLGPHGNSCFHPLVLKAMTHNSYDMVVQTLSNN